MWWLLSLLPILIVGLGALGQYYAFRDDEISLISDTTTSSEKDRSQPSIPPQGEARASATGAFGLEVRRK